MGSIKGKIIDAVDNEPLAGAYVYLVDAQERNLGIGITTDSEGRFELVDPLLNNADQLLALRYLGMVTKVMPRSSFRGQTIALDPSINILKEVVVRPDSQPEPIASKPGKKPNHLIITGSAVLIIVLIMVLKPS